MSESFLEPLNIAFYSDCTHCWCRISGLNHVLIFELCSKCEKGSKYPGKKPYKIQQFYKPSLTSEGSFVVHNIDSNPRTSHNVVCFEVVTTLFGRQQRCYNVETTSCV